jgi:hypothetical protein
MLSLGTEDGIGVVVRSLGLEGAIPKAQKPHPSSHPPFFCISEIVKIIATRWQVSADEIKSKAM